MRLEKHVAAPKPQLFTFGCGPARAATGSARPRKIMHATPFGSTHYNSEVVDTTKSRIEVESRLPPLYVIETALLAGLFQLRDQSAIHRFLVKNAFLRPLLNEVREAVREHFPDGPLALDVVTDVEADAEPILRLTVLVTMNGKEAFQRLDMFDEKWWLDNVERTQGRLMVDVEFV